MRLILLAALLGGVAADDSTCGETPLARSTASPSIEIDSSSNILDFLNEKVLEESVLADIRTNLVAGKVVLIRDAFKLEFAEWAHSLLHTREADNHYLSTDGGVFTTRNTPKEAGAFYNKTRANELTWEINEWERKSRDRDRFYDPNYPGHNTVKHYTQPTFGEARAMRDVFSHNVSREFMSSISGRKCDGSDGLGLGLKFMEYSKGDHSNVHTNLIWYLSKDWKPEWGGSFYWANSPNSAASGYLSPAFNSLVVFVPTVASTHIVTPVRDDAEGRRQTITYLPPTRPPAPLEWIASRMNPGNATNLARRKKLEELKVSVRNYLRPFDDSVIIIEGDEGGDEDYGSEDALTNDFSIHPNTSIIDLLDPSLTEDEELLDEIRQNLLLGNLVVIEDAFKPGKYRTQIIFHHVGEAHVGKYISEYAKHVMNALNDDELKWNREVVRPYHADVPGHVTQSNTLDKTSHSDKVKDALRPLDHSTIRKLRRACVHLAPITGLQIVLGERICGVVISRRLMIHLLLTDCLGCSLNLLGGSPNVAEGQDGKKQAFWSKGKCLTVSGSYELGSSKSQQVNDDHLSELAEMPEGLGELSWAQKRWLARDMDVMTLTKDTYTQKQLHSLKTQAEEQLQNPGEKQVFTI
ncbi:hypothetical protein THAOC_13166 [Thalassiosira oceanica]|uniref:Prolyl 4-hydroxylase alpha subunit Fe(2+) 2OG dioxygenase domain-containing protein n=2 Tax=Thalassiosira oceanica TaxID=159749 RepID=K0T663_THAOC|nr:hypothetical protein THAOC_13166 [Thalassiosira oceanica]|eukprot:EJK65932.1 hypothetical protein THAOC_13166 [Thalassiosira oceanica]